VARPDTGNSVLGWIAGHLIWPTKSVEVVDSQDWLEIVDMFVGSAKVVEKAGWHGVQIHSAHGYLLAEFLSPLVGGRYTDREEWLMGRPTLWLDLCPAYQLTSLTDYICSTSSWHDCATRRARSSSRP
jgi:hypothetical protein